MTANAGSLQQPQSAFAAQQTAGGSFDSWCPHFYQGLGGQAEQVAQTMAEGGS